MDGRFGRQWVPGVLMFLSLSGCGGLGETGGSLPGISSGGGETTFTDEVVGGNVAALSFDGGVDLSDLSDGEDVVVMLYAFNAAESAEGFTLSSANAPLPDASGFPAETEPPRSLIGGAPDLTEEFHSLLREREEELAGPAAEPADRARFAVFEVGEGREFKVLDSFSGADDYDVVGATLRLQNEYFEFYVDDRDAESLADDELAELAENFAAVIPSERALLGTETDVNGDGRFAVLFTREVNDLGSSSGGIVTGFFYAVDLFDSSMYGISNEMEVYFTFVPDPAGSFGATISKSFALGNILPGVLPHEYQHMISFNSHYFRNGGPAEVGWLNEGLSHLAEDIYNRDAAGFMAAAGLENPARVASYLGGISNICFTCGASLSQRGGAYLFLRYLYEQAEKGLLPGAENGSEFLAKLLDTNKRGVANVTSAAFGEDGGDAEFKDILGLFGLAVYLSGSSYAADSRLELDGLGLRELQNDNRGTVLNGPALLSVSALPFTDTITGNGLTYLQIPGSVIREAGGILSLDVGAGSDFGGYLIR